MPPLSRRGAPHKEIRHMAEDNFTLTTFYTSWKEYQDHIKGALAPLKASQLELRAAPHLRSIGENALHIIGCRAGWFTDFLGEDCGADVKAYASWDVPGAPARTPAEMGQALDHRSEEHTSELQSQSNLVCRLLLEKKTEK